jgi:hypothetical protein
VIGADHSSRSFVGVGNPDEFDEARIRARLEKYLQPVPQFEVFNLESSDNKIFVLLVFPKQRTRRILARETVQDSSGKTPKLLLRQGDLWTKGQSTGKRLATAEDWDEIYEDKIELETERRTRQRTAHFLERATAQEKLRGGYALPSVPSFSTDEEFKVLIESLCISQDRARFLILLEGLRDDLVEGWYSIGAFERDDQVIDIQASFSERIANVRDHKTNVFSPAMQRLTCAAIYIVKNGGPPEFLARAIHLLEEVYETADRLHVSYMCWLSPRGLMSASAPEHLSHTVPALESLIALHLVGAYVAKRGKFEYLPVLLRRVVRAAGGEVKRDNMQPFSFWPLERGWGEPSDLGLTGNRIKLCVERVQNDPALLKLFGSGQGAIEALCQYELLLEFNSYLAVDEKETPQSVSYMRKWHPEVSFDFWTDLIAFPMGNIAGLALQILTEIQNRNSAFLKPLLFNENLVTVLVDGGEATFAKLLRQLDNDRRQLALELRKFLFPAPWPKKIAEALGKLERVA